MRKVAPLHPEARRILELIAEMEAGVVPPLPLSEMRALMRKRTARLADVPPAVGRIENFAVQTSAGPVPVRLYYPKHSEGRMLPAYVYAHGGGFVVGDLDMVETICRSACHGADAVVVSVDYRLAPEHRFPAGLQDMIAVTRWVAANGERLGIDARHLAIGGDSAGGNLAAAAAQALTGSDGVSLRYQVLIYPVLDLTCSQPSYRELGTGYPLTEERMRTYIGLYLADPANQASDPRASPLLAESVTGVPPALVILAGLDPLVDEGRAFAGRLKESGIPVDLHEVPDHPHGFLGWSREAQAARDMLSLISVRLRERLHGANL